MTERKGQRPLDQANRPLSIDKGTNIRMPSSDRRVIGQSEHCPTNKGKLIVRSPAVEIFLHTIYSPLLPTKRKALRDTNIDKAFFTHVQEIFGSSIHLEVISLVHSPVGRPHTIGNNIHINIKELERSTKNERRRWLITLMHELAHIWQFQTRGLKYISDSLYHQGKYAAQGVPIVGPVIALADPKHPYEVNTEKVTLRDQKTGELEYEVIHITNGNSIYDLGAEEQAVVIEKYYEETINFLGLPNYKGNSDYRALKKKYPDHFRMVAEVKKSKPIPKIVRQKLILEEARFGPQLGHAMRSSRERVFKVKRQLVPLIRIEF